MKTSVVVTLITVTLLCSTGCGMIPESIDDSINNEAKNLVTEDRTISSFTDDELQLIIDEYSSWRIPTMYSAAKCIIAQNELILRKLEMLENTQIIIHE